VEQHDDQRALTPDVPVLTRRASWGGVPRPPCPFGQSPRVLASLARFARRGLPEWHLRLPRWRLGCYFGQAAAQEYPFTCEWSPLSVLDRCSSAPVLRRVRTVRRLPELEAWVGASGFAGAVGMAVSWAEAVVTRHRAAWATAERSRAAAAYHRVERARAASRTAVERRRAEPVERQGVAQAAARVPVGSGGGAPYGCPARPCCRFPTIPRRGGPWEVGVQTVTVGRLTVELLYPAQQGSSTGMQPATYDLTKWLPESEQSRVPAANSPRSSRSAATSTAGSPSTRLTVLIPPRS